MDFMRFLKPQFGVSEQKGKIPSIQVPFELKQFKDCRKLN